MTSLVASESVTVIDELSSTIHKSTFHVNCAKNEQRRHVLKAKENVYKHKCNKVLKRKLKKYKLRQDGCEDQDVLDVSKILVSALIIKSPSSLKHPANQDGADFEDYQPTPNYLFKMGRRKETLKISKSLKHSNAESKQNAIMTSPNTNQDNKQTNAFKLLMDSRNKSIGSNSPGKEKKDDVTEIEEVERKSLKAKRQLLLQKMAEAKGSIRNKEIEEYQDKVIQKKMDIRAEKLKSMILKDAKSVKENKDTNKKTAKTQEREGSQKVEVINNNVLKKANKSLKIVDIFNTIEEPINVSPVKKFIPKEDQEFLNKLSPSLKKKESMLSYFKKLEKDFDCPEDSNDNIIKVKLQPRSKKKGRKKLSLKKESTAESSTSEIINVIEENDIIDIDGPNDNNLQVIEKDTNTISVNNNKNSLEETVPLEKSILNDLTVKSDRQKRKRNGNIVSKVNEAEKSTLNNDSRPKRSVKRPMKYTDDYDDVYMSSSDEELHIFTPRKKKHIESVAEVKETIVSKPQKTIEGSLKLKLGQKVAKGTDSPKKPSKLAPIFAPKQIDPAALEAKQKFLQSGVPDKLKRVINQQKNNQTQDPTFPVVVHIQQNCKAIDKCELLIPLMDVNEDLLPLSYEESAFKKLLHLTDEPTVHSLDNNCRNSTQSMLQNIKHLHPKFPVYRTYRYLKSKGTGELKDCSNVDLDNSIEILSDVVDVINDSPDRLNWTDKYKAMSTKQIIGNFESIKELRKWLILWTENELKQKSRNKPKAGSDSSDYYQSDTDSRDSMKTMNNLLILTGPTGCGKTASVYAVAAELAMKVIEVNASSKRTGKIMLQDLQEATQSHKVNRGSGIIDNSQKSQEKSQVELIKIKKRGRPKKGVGNEKIKKVVKCDTSSTPPSQESSRTDSSLILIDDADIVFEQDDGFSSAILQLVQCSKRPVILITSSTVCPHLQRFLQYGKILKMYPLLPRILGTWLDIMCLADSGVCWPGAGAQFLSYFKGDIRKTINYLQFYTPIYVHNIKLDEETASQNVDIYRPQIDEEGSCMSWADNDDSEGRTPVQVVSTNTIWTDFVSKHSNLFTFLYPVQLFNIWWSLPHLLTTQPNFRNIDKSNDRTQSKNICLELEAMANAVDAFSLADYISHRKPDSNTNLTSKPWYCPEEHSVSERENWDSYKKEYETTDEICHHLVTSSIAAAQTVLGCEKKMEFSLPGMNLQREKDKIVARHKSLTSYLNTSSTLDRRSLALDYWPSCRSICRAEKSKNDTNMKRNNRFCHYLKSLNVLCKSDTFDNLCDSLCSNEGTESNN
ncbi:unnamed protein product [Chrysodeixis includens]|uniref:AAA+ ATPase domain-containing protein n=1 Tax=Chrysodeixis includens TaxID=689277 RepID=A0A9P0FSA9_CHRIL|nr:unnamed protein product [Chrysodeixis includens]